MVCETEAISIRSSGAATLISRCGVSGQPATEAQAEDHSSVARPPTTVKKRCWGCSWRGRIEPRRGVCDHRSGRWVRAGALAAGERPASERLYLQNGQQPPATTAVVAAAALVAKSAHTAAAIPNTLLLMVNPFIPVRAFM